MRTSVDRILTTHVGSLQTPDYIDPDYLFEAANGRHEHEYTLWRDTKLKSMAEGASIASQRLWGHA